MEQTAKQQVAEKLRQANNVLVTVSKNPSVDQLASAVGLTLMLNKLGKHTTCVFSGKVPDTMEFLEPQKTIETTVDSLRDFIISLDKDKADKLRYKVDGDVVKIFITPYRTKIGKDDIRFEQGDFNVDAVVALGVTNRDDIDAAIAAHGRILHDASVIGVNTGETTSNIGSIDWHEPSAGSLSEMLVSISESLEGNIIDAQMATAFLTGIVAATDRFSNERTSPKVMTMSAQLMAAGANQQLIAQNLGEDGKPVKSSTELNINEEGAPTEASAKVSHDDEDLPEVPKPTEKSEESKPTEEIKLPEPINEPTPAIIDTPEKAPEPAIPEVKPLDSSLIDNKAPFISPARGSGPKEQDASENPTLGGTFNATSSYAQEEAAAKKEKLNNEILAHPVEPTGQLDFSQPATSAPEPTNPVQAPKVGVDEARAAVENAISGGDFFPDNNPKQGVGSQPLPDMPVLDQAPVLDTFSPPPATVPAPMPSAPTDMPPDMPPPFPPPGLSPVPTPPQAPQTQPEAMQSPPQAPPPPPSSNDFVIPNLPGSPPPIPPQPQS